MHTVKYLLFTPTGDYPNIALPDLKWRTLNHFTHLASQKIALWTSRSGFDQVRRRVGLPKRKLFSPFDDDPLHPRTPILCAWSPSILPPASDWLPYVHVTGYCFFDLNDSYQPPAELQNFLDAAPHDWLLPRCELIIHHGGLEQHPQVCAQAYQILSCRSPRINPFGGIESMRLARVQSLYL